MLFGYTRHTNGADAAGSLFPDAGIEQSNLFIDHCSVKSRERPALSHLLVKLKEGDRILIPAFDQLASSLKELTSLLDQITARGAEVHFISEDLTISLDPKNPMNRSAFQIFAALSSWERTIKQARQSEGFAQAQNEGRRLGRPTKITEEQRERVRRAFSQDLFLNVARLSRETGVPETTCRDIRKKMQKDAAEEKKAISFPLVWHWKECTLENLLRALTTVQSHLSGRIAVKLNSGDPNEKRIIPPLWVRELVTRLPNSSAVDCNVLYDGLRRTTAGHLTCLEINGWSIPIDIMDADGDVTLPVEEGFHLREIAVGSHLLQYNSLLVLTHFNCHSSGGFSGSLKNVALGCASGALGKAQVHGLSPAQTNSFDYRALPSEERFIESMVDSGKAITDRFKNHLACITIMRKTVEDGQDFGILASTDIVATDQASVDLVAGKLSPGKMPFRQLSAMQELGLGRRNYRLVEV